MIEKRVKMSAADIQKNVATSFQYARSKSQKNMALNCQKESLLAFPYFLYYLEDYFYSKSEIFGPTEQNKLKT